MASFRKTLRVLVAVLAVLASSIFFNFTPVEAALLGGCPPDVETCHDLPRFVQGHGCHGSTCFSDAEICCL